MAALNAFKALTVSQVSGLDAELDGLVDDDKAYAAASYGILWPFAIWKEIPINAGDVVSGSDGKLYKLASDAIGTDHGEVADTTERDALTADHGDVCEITGDQQYRYDESLETAAWVAWNGTNAIAAYSGLDPTDGVTSWVKVVKDTFDDSDVGPISGKGAALGIASRVNAQQGGNYSYFQGASDAINPMILDDVSTGRLKVDDRIWVGSRFLYSEYSDGLIHGEFPAVIVPQTEGTDGDGIHFNIGSLRLKMLFPKGEYRATQLGIRDTASTVDMSAQLNAMTTLTAGKTLILDDITYHIKSLLVRSNSTLMNANGGSIRLMDDVAIDAGVNYYPINNLTYDNVTYKKLVVDGNRENNLLFNVCDGVTVTGDGSQIVDCEIRHAPDACIMLSGGKGQYAGRNILEDCPDAGIYANNSVSGSGHSAVIENNEMYNTESGGVMAKRYSKKLVIEGNRIEGDNVEIGISINDADLGSLETGKSSISGNNIDIAGEMGIALNDSNEIAVTGNPIRLRKNSTNPIGIRIAGCREIAITGNPISGDKDTNATTNVIGIQIADRSGNGSKGIAVSGNTITNCERARKVTKVTADSSVISFTGNTITDCTLDLRVDANLTSSAVVVSKANIADCPSEIFAGATVIRDDVDTSQTAPEKIAGMLYTTAAADPNGVLTASFAGQKAVTTSGGRRFWKSYGLGNDKWLPDTNVQAAADANDTIAAAAGTDATIIDALTAELHDLKDKLRTAGLIAS